MNIWMFKLDLEKAEEPEIKLPTFAGLKNGKTSTSSLLTMLMHLTVQITTNYGKFLKGNTRSPYLLPEKSVCS